MSVLHTYSDGGARGNPGPSAVGAVICDARGRILEETAECIGVGTNNQAEYRAMLKALERAKALGGRRLVCFADSELLIFQLQGVYRIKDARLATLAEKVQSAASEFDAVTWKQVPREHPMITRADKLLNQALNRAKARAPLARDPIQGEMF